MSEKEIELLNEVVPPINKIEHPIPSTSHNTKNNEIGFQPTKKWYKKYRMSSIDNHVIQNIILSSIEDSLEELLDVLEDSEILNTNFPSYTKKEIEDFIDEKYLKKSKFISKLKSFLRKEEDRIFNSFNKNEMDWVEENLFW